MKKQRILLITRNLPPLVGGMERLNWHMADELSKYAEVKVVGPTGAAAVKPENVQVLESPLKPLVLFMLIALCKAFWTAVCFKPNVIIAGSGLTAPLVWLISKLTGAKSVVYLHGFDITAAHWVYQKIWVPFFRRMDCVIVNSTPTKILALNAGVLEKDISIVHPGVTLPVSAQSSNAIQSFKKKYNLEHKKILLSVGRLTTRKGLKEFVENSLAYIVQQEPDVVLVVVGESPKNSLGAGLQTREEILEVARKNQIENHILFLGVITDNEQLATIYEAADVHVFPVRHIPDDPEGFGMVAIEAAAHGLPTVAFATGGIVDAIGEGVSGYLIENDNYPELSQQIINSLQEPLKVASIQVFAKGFAWGNFSKVTNLVIKNDK
ncbi:glycosyltransferase family 4 protein [Acinetobacter celticus]|uniref:Glycosyl transferase n=1 Tax=Acinetobacter celticus TaxID=1891224 RepID=A0A1C3CTR8_9GAMM|nr:glycosyltransferase family 4 protein [Acinetobacter celticus]ODA12141.1 glycosyl transferase [Acinetobacter celticus]